ncbi:hypothetical protein BBP40_011484 [Aspergillus hancockii]|nr:hypothetical protein BBP40_011484 [Aspergillus hancockii]
MTIQVIDPEGDIIIECGGNGDMFRVSSKILSTASPVFYVMFKPHFKEGAAMVAGSIEPVVIALPEDDPVAFLTLCSICMENLAVLVDKYQCRGAVVALGSVWLSKSARGLHVASMCQLLLFAYVLDLPSKFLAISKEILFAYTRSFTDLALLREHCLFPDNILVEFERRRYELRRTIRKVIMNQLDGLCASADNHNRYISFYMKKLQANGFPGTDIFESRAFLQIWTDSFKLRTYHQWPCKINNCVGMTNNAANQNVELTRLTNKIEAAALGICLDCLRSDGSTVGKCREIHPKLGDDKRIFAQ